MGGRPREGQLGKAGGKAISLLDASLATSRELARRPLMKRVLWSQRERRKA